MAANTTSNSSEAAEKELPGSAQPSHSDHLANLIHVYRQPIEQRVKFSSIIPNMLCMRDIQYEVFTAEIQGNQKKAAALFFKHLDEVYDDGKFQSFVDALRQCKYSVLVSALEDKDVDFERLKEHETLLNLFFTTIAEKIDHEIVSEKLQECGVISPEDCERIRKRLRHESCHEANIELFMAIQRLKENWYKEFLNVLYNLGYEELVKEIDDKFYSEKQGDTQETINETPVSEVAGSSEVTLRERNLMGSESLPTTPASSVTDQTYSSQQSVPLVQANASPNLNLESVQALSYPNIGDGRADAVFQELADMKSLMHMQMGLLQSISEKMENMDRKISRLENNLEMIAKLGNDSK